MATRASCAAARIFVSRRDIAKWGEFVCRREAEEVVEGTFLGSEIKVGYAHEYRRQRGLCMYVYTREMGRRDMPWQREQYMRAMWTRQCVYVYRIYCAYAYTG